MNVGVGAVDYLCRSGRLEVVREGRREIRRGQPRRRFFRRAQVEELIKRREAEEDEARARRKRAAEMLFGEVSL
jgi:hypothetical protein